MSRFIGNPIGYTRKGKPVYMVRGGSTPDGEGVQGPTTDTDTGSAEPQENAAPWAQYLEPLPESVRPLVEPAFKQWDADVTKRFQTYSQKQAEYEPWQPVIEQYGDPQQAQAAFQLMQAINENPEQVYQALVQEFGFGSDQGGSEPEIDDPDTGLVDPEFAQVKQMTEQMAEIFLAQEQERQQAQEDAELESYLGDLREKHGDYDEQYVLALINAGLTGEEAVERFRQLVSKAAPAAGPAPRILGAGGGLPSEAVDPAKLSSKDTKSLVAQMLAAQAAES